MHNNQNRSDLIRHTPKSEGSPVVEAILKFLLALVTEEAGGNRKESRETMWR